MKTIVSIALAIMLAANGAANAAAVSLSANGNVVGVYKNSYALIIGNDDYTHEDDLGGVKRDISIVKAALEANEFQTEDVYANATGEQLRQRIDEFVDKYGYQEDARIVIWFAGHGTTVNGEGYLLGTDVPALKPDSPTLNQDLRTFYKAALPLRSFGITLRQMRSRHVLLVLDTCFAATIFDTTRSAAHRSREIEMKNPTRQIITAGGVGQKVADDGKFARLFADAVGGVATHNGQAANSNKDGYLSGTELGYFLSQAAETSRQKPQYGKLVTLGSGTRDQVFGIDVGNSDFEKGEFFFVLPRGDEADAQPVAQPGEPEQVVWRELAEGTHIVAGADPAPIYVRAPPATGEKRFALRSGEQFPPAGVLVKFQSAKIGERNWVRFLQDDIQHYVLEGDVSVVRPQ